jgi:hypothetical protein
MLLFGLEQYKIEDFGLSCVQSSHGHSLNNLGQVCGTYTMEKNNPDDPDFYLFLWDPKRGLMTLDLPWKDIKSTFEERMKNTPSKNINKVYCSIEIQFIKITNNSEIFVSLHGVKIDDLSRSSLGSVSFLLDSEFGLIDIESKSGIDNLVLIGANDRGQVLAHVDHNRYWLIDIYSGQINFLSDNFIPNKINNNGEIFGCLRIPHESKHIYRAAVRLSNGEVITLPLDKNSTVVHVNDNGLAVVSIHGTKTYNVFWKIQENTLLGLPKEVIGLLSNCEISRINNNGDYVMKNSKNNNYNGESYSIYRSANEEIEDVTDNLCLEADPTHNWMYFHEISDLNDHRQILGHARNTNWKFHAILLTPNL